MATFQNQFPNPGVFVVENDKSTYSIPTYSGVVHLVLGSSKNGTFNTPILVDTVTQFRSIYGTVDSKLERKSSYFHRTCEKMLGSGPIYCFNILNSDPELDILYWKKFSCATHLDNLSIKSSSYESLFDRTGFWKRTKEQVLFTTNKQDFIEGEQLLTVVNYGRDPLTFFIFKSTVNGFDITLENWYGEINESIPEYLSSKDWASDYMVRFIAVYGDYTNYQQLATDQRWNRYFNASGLIKEEVENFIRDINVKLVGDYTVSLIPYFKDLNGNDLYIESIINKFTDSTGIFVTFDSDTYETSYRNGLIDLTGANLIQKTNFVLNYLSYDEVVADTITIPESKLDLVNNSWGDPNWFIGRTNLLTEGYIHNIFLKPLIISQTTSFLISPLEVSSDSYAILKGKRIDLSTPPEYLLELNQLTIPGTHFALTLVLTLNGVEFRVGTTSVNTGTLDLPEIDADTEITIGYYKIDHTLQGDFLTSVHPVSITTTGLPVTNSILPWWIPPFRSSFDPLEISKISFTDYSTQPTYQLIMVFENASSIIRGDYNQNRTYYLLKQLVKNIVEHKSIILDVPSAESPTGGAKQKIVSAQQNVDGDNVTLLLEIENQNANIRDNGKLDLGYISIYYDDQELIIQTETTATTTNQPYVIGSGGILGKDSELYRQYYDGLINTGDRVFRDIDTEVNLRFRVRNGRNELLFEGIPAEKYKGKLFVSGTTENDGIYTIVSSFIDQGNLVLIFRENVVEEFVEQLTIYDANREFYLKFSLQDDELAVEYIEQFLGKDEFYKNTQTTISQSYRRTLEIEQIIDSYTILVDYDRYAGKIDEGEFIDIVAVPTSHPNEIARGIGRLTDVHPYDDEKTLLLVRADSPIDITAIKLVIPAASTSGIIKLEEKITNLYFGIDKWILTYKGSFLNGFSIREESLPNGTDEKLKEILTVVSPDTGLFNSLANPDNITWRYLIDSYGIGFDPNVKRPFALLCKNHNSLGFINLPSIKQFVNNDSLVFDNNGVFNIDLLTRGGIQQNSNVNRFKLIDGDESSYISYFFPNVLVNDSDTRRVKSIPPAAWVASTFMEVKWETNQNDIYPWSAAAGSLRGRINDLTNLEFKFNEEDLGKLNQFNLNPLTNDSDARFWIFSNNTAWPVKSSIGFINVREALIDLENALRQMLLSFHWDFNTKQNRISIVRAANIICDDFKKRNAINAFFNQMDEENNTNEIIDAGIGVLDTFVEPIQAMGTIILQIQILKTGQLSSGQFLK